MNAQRPLPCAPWHAVCSNRSRAPLPQAKYFLTEAPLDAPITPRVLAGAALWAAGWATNLQARGVQGGGRGRGRAARRCRRVGWRAGLQLTDSVACALPCVVAQADHILINLRRPGETGGWAGGWVAASGLDAAALGGLVSPL